MEPRELKNVIEAALLAAGRPLTVNDLQALFAEPLSLPADEVRTLLAELSAEYAGRGIELVEVASGWRLQVRQSLAPWIARLWEERPARYSRALLETLALIAYRQPITRGEIEDVRGVAVSSHIIKTLQDREWVRIVGHREVPGRPALYATTRQFLDYFGLKSLDELPTLMELNQVDLAVAELPLEMSEEAVAADDAEATLVVTDGEDTLEKTMVRESVNVTDVTETAEAIEAVEG
jgi:segregation and condensation protein B